MRTPKLTIWNALPALLLLLAIGTGCDQSGEKRHPGSASPENTESFAWLTRHDESSGIPSESRPGASTGKYSQFQQIFADVAEAAIPGVVSIYSERNLDGPGSGAPLDDRFDMNPFEYFFGPGGGGHSAPRTETGLGSGVIISPQGYILTNNHVVEGADIIKVRLSDGSEYQAKVVGVDKPSDVAVIRIEKSDSPLPALPVGNSDNLRIGEWVMAVGNPYGLSHTVTSGIISAMGRRNTGITGYEDFLQTDAAINPGNSGGALLNLDGELIGINTAIFSRTGGHQGIGFAIPINMAKRITEDLIRDGIVTRGWLGVSIQSINKELAEALKLTEQSGALVGDVIPGGPAQKAGIKRGDIIQQINGQKVRDVSELLNLVALLKPGARVHVEVLRDGEIRKHEAVISRRDENRLSALELDPGAPAGKAKVGLEVVELNEEAINRYGINASVEQGVLVARVAAGSRAEDAKLQEGDVILEVNRTSIHSLKDFNRAMEEASRGNRVLLLVYRDGKTFFTTL